MLFTNTNMRTAMAYTNAVGDKVYPIIVDIKKGIKSTEEISFVSSDINTGILSVAFIQGNDTYNISGAEVICSIMRPDASTLEIPCNIINTNVVEVPLGINGTSQDGIYSFDFKVFKGGNKIVGTPIMNYSVSLSISNDLVVEEDDRLPVLTMLMTQVGALKEETTEVISQANDAIELARVATNNATQATTVANVTINQINQDTANAIDRLDTAVGNVDNKITEVETRFNTLTASQQQDSEIIDARDGETSLKARLDRDIEKAKEIYVPVEGSNISTDSSVGYLKDVEIKGNTIQDAENLADIRSVGDKVEGQELYEIPVISRGKNLWNGVLKDGDIGNNDGLGRPVSGHAIPTDYVKCPSNTNIVISYTVVASSRWFAAYEYDKDKNYLGYTEASKFTTKPNTRYIKFKIENSANIDIKDLMIEVGTQVTPYEPYQEDKLTILSPVQLEKVGDVADRIVCKDGVWGVEKNIDTVILDGSDDFGYYLASSQPVDTTLINIYVSKALPKASSSSSIISNRFTNNSETEAGNCYRGGSNNVHFILSKAIIGDATMFKSWLQENPTTIMYELAQPQFIPLPHDQQIKLRTFANKTNISFGCEIEGTIKAQVPKSLGATVNTHTEQIGNLSKELDRVEKLEESTVSTVTTESDFTTVEETSNGYFEDVKLEGKTLVNLFNFRQLDITNQVNIYVKAKDYDLTKGKEVTLVNNTDKEVIYDIWKDSSWVRSVIPSANTCIKTTLEENEYIQCCYGAGARGWDANSESDKEKMKKTCIVLEGDHTQNPPSYFEGLMSVGQDVDEVSVNSCGKNLIDNIDIYDSMYVSGSSVTGVENSYKVAKFNISKKIKTFTLTVKPKDGGVNFVGGQVLVGVEGKIDSSNYMSIKDVTTSMTKTFENKNGYILIGYYGVDDLEFKNKIKQLDIQLENNVIATKYSEYIGDKKPLLYYNNETQAWEKPILRQWDSIEKHSDGKYYYHKRSGEVVLNGSEDWKIHSATNERFLRFYIFKNDMLIQGRGISDRFPWQVAVTQANSTYELIGSHIDSPNLYVNILVNRLSTQDVQGFKQWLQTNNVTVIYQLAEEKVYECTNIDLITYANETNYVVNCGAIVPKTTLKVHNNISNVVSLLQKKVSLLEDKFIQGLKQVLAGDMYSLAELLYPEDFKTENSVMTIPLD